MIKNQNILLIIECCKEEKDLKLIEEKVKFIDNWSEFISLSYMHGVFPLVYNCLKKYDCLIPKEFFTSMKSRYLDIVKSNMFMTNELLNILEILKENNIKAIPFKGPILSQMAYGDVVSRQYIDLDIFIFSKDIKKIKNIFLNYNYIDLLNLNEFELNFRKKNSHELTFYNKEKKITLELHWNLVDNDSPTKLLGLNINNNPYKLIINQKCIDTISIEKQLIYLCVHGSSHLYERFEWLVDIDKLIRNNKCDWDEFLHLILLCSEVKESIYFSLYSTHKLLNTPLPNKMIISKYDRLYKKTIFNNNINIISHIFIRSKFFDSYKNKIYYIYKMFFKPTLNEIKIIKLNGFFYPVYFFIRFYLVIKKYLRK